MRNHLIKEIVYKIIFLEKKHNLFSIKYKNKYLIWPFYRMYFYYGFLRNQKIIGVSGESATNINWKSIKMFFKFIKNSNLSNILRNQKKNYLIISSQRYIENEEMYTKDLKLVLKNNYIELSFSDKFNFHAGPIYLDLFKIIIRLGSILFNKFISTPIRIKNFMKEIGASTEFNTEFNKYKIEFILWFCFYKIILKIQKPKKIFFVSGVYFTPMIAAARSLGIVVYEIQHGVINNMHLAYEFPNLKGNSFFSHGILMLSDYWKLKANYPIGTKLITIGNNFFNSKQLLIKQFKKVVIISDGAFSQEIIKFITININFFKLNGFEINYKLHPGEIYNWELRYDKLKTLRNNGLIKVISKSPVLSDLLLTSEFVFGINSTAIYEGLDRGCTTFILDIESSEYFDDLAEKGVVKKINPNKLLSISDFQFIPQKRPKFFTPTKFDVLHEIVNI